MTKCKLCYREMLLPLIFDNNIKDYEYKFEKDLCVVCNLHKEIIGIRKRTTDFEIRKLQFIIIIINRVSHYYDDERRIQQNDFITIWKNDKYFNQWYNEKFGKDTNKKIVKKVLNLYFDKKGKLNENNQNTINLKNKKLFKQWVINNYYILKN